MGTPIPQERGTTSNRYTILGRLAGGGMADIFLVLATTEAGVDRHLVLKRVLAERSRDPVFAKMFLDEARLAAQLQHPNIAQVYDVGSLGGSYFFTMEYVHGEDVRALLHKLSKQKRRVPANLALYIASGALAALHHAHERTTKDGEPLGVVHRDVTPSNIMVSFEGVVKLLDFGVAKASQRSTESRSGAIKGKIAYLSPEQCKGTKVDRRSDIFSLGICLFEMLTCKRLYKRESDFMTMSAITTEQVPPPSKFAPDLSPEIDRIVATALEKDRDKRYATAEAMLEDIEAVATVERQLMSAGALGRLMREVFGTKPEPWKQLPTPEQIAEPVTITNEGETTPMRATPALGAAALLDLDGLRVQLERAPDLRPVDETDEPSQDSIEPAITTPPVEPPKSVRPVAPGKSRWPLVVLLIALLGAGGFLAYRELQPPPKQPDVASAVPVTIDAAPLVVIDADVAVVADASPPPPAVAIVDDCASDPATLAADVRTKCAIAACENKQRAKAVLFHRVAGAERVQIEAACRRKGIVLGVRAIQTPPPKKPPIDPCKNPAYVEANPFKCQ